MEIFLTMLGTLVLYDAIKMVLYAIYIKHQKDKVKNEMKKLEKILENVNVKDLPGEVKWN